MSKLENPHVYPSSGAHPDGWPREYLGITLLDYFAGQALAGTLSSSELMSGAIAKASEKNVKIEFVLVTGIYNLAEAMLKEREKRGS